MEFEIADRHLFTKLIEFSKDRSNHTLTIKYRVYGQNMGFEEFWQNSKFSGLVSQKVNFRRIAQITL